MSDPKLLPAELCVSGLRYRLKSAPTPGKSLSLHRGPATVRIDNTHLLILKPGAAAAASISPNATPAAPSALSSAASTVSDLPPSATTACENMPPRMGQATPLNPDDVVLQLDYSAISALRFVQSTFGKATVFFEGAREAPFYYCYFELPNRFSHLLEDALEKNVPSYVRRQIVPEWLYANFFANMPHMYYRRELRIAVNLIMLLVRAAVLAFLVTSIFRETELIMSVTTTTGLPDPAAIAWAKLHFVNPIRVFFHSRVYPLVKHHWLLSGALLVGSSIIAAPIVGLLLTFFLAWQLIFHGSVFVFHVVTLKDMILQVAAGVVELRSLATTGRLWLSNFLLRGGPFARLLKIDPNKPKKE
jgi:hypothetical protein